MFHTPGTFAIKVFGTVYDSNENQIDEQVVQASFLQINIKNAIKQLRVRTTNHHDSRRPVTIRPCDATKNEMTLPRFGLSYFWDVYLPLGITAIPASAFVLIRPIAAGLNQPGVEAPQWVNMLMSLLMIAGITAMAVVVLVRLEVSEQQLIEISNGSPSVARKLCLFAAMIFLIFFDILTNVSAAFQGAGPLLIAAIPLFVAYLVCIRLTFAGLTDTDKSAPDGFSQQPD